VVEVHLVEVRLVEPQSSLSEERSGMGREFRVFGCGVLYGWDGYGYSMMCMGASGPDRFALTRANMEDWKHGWVSQPS
jgi:hypothetical protein